MSFVSQLTVMLVMFTALKLLIPGTIAKVAVEVIGVMEDTILLKDMTAVRNVYSVFVERLYMKRSVSPSSKTEKTLLDG